MNLDNDNIIIQKVLQGDVNAYSELVARYQNYVFTLALRIVKNREDAEEVAQDSFIKAYSYLKDFRADSKFSTWLYTIVQRNAISHLRKKRLDTSEMNEERYEYLADKSSILENINYNTDKALLSKAMNLLKPDDASILSLFYLQEQSLEEIGQIIGLDTNTCKVRLFRARQKLKVILENNFTELKR